MTGDELKDAANLLAEQARRNEASAPRKHHLVPSFYLRQWEQHGRLRVTDVDNHRSFLTSASNAARETDFYSLESEDLDEDEVPPLLAETALSRLESDAAVALDALLESPASISSQQRFDLTVLMLMQHTRGRLHREGQEYLTNAYHRVLYGDLDRSGVRDLLREREDREPTVAEVQSVHESFQALKRGDLVVHPQRPQMVMEAMRLAIEGGGCLYSRVWTLMTCPRPLLTTDEPLLALGFESDPRDERVGLGVAPVIFFPLTPQDALAMFHPVVAPYVGVADGGRGEFNVTEVVALSHELLATSHRWAFEQPVDEKRSLGLRLRVPARLESARFEMVGGARGPRGGEIMRFYAPTRWSNAARIPPSPIRGWFPHSMNLPPLTDFGDDDA